MRLANDGPMRALLIVLAVAGLVLALYVAMHHSVRPAATAASGPPVAPDLALTDLDGGALHTSDYKGKVVLVNFWAAWCTPCAEEVPQFMALQTRYKDQGLQVIGFSVDDDPQKLRDFYRKYQMNYPVVESNLRIADEFGNVLGLPTTFVIGREGRIQAKHDGATDFSALEREVVELLHAPQDR